MLQGAHLWSVFKMIALASSPRNFQSCASVIQDTKSSARVPVPDISCLLRSLSSLSHVELLFTKSEAGPGASAWEVPNGDELKPQEAEPG